MLLHLRCGTCVTFVNLLLFLCPVFLSAAIFVFLKPLLKVPRLRHRILLLHSLLFVLFNHHGLDPNLAYERKAT